jgi:hypothetical protein
VTVAQRTGDQGLADALAGRIVRHRGRCQYPRCERTDVVWAHIIRRRYSATRCMEEAAAALCPTHHDLVDSFPDEMLRLIDATIGRERYDELRTIAEAGHPLSAKLWWASEVSRLKARCVELGLPATKTDPRRNAA